MSGALLVFLGAAILTNAGDVTAFFVRLVGFSCAIFGVMIFIGHALRAHAIDLIPFEDLVLAGVLVLLGSIVGLFPDFFAKVLFSILGFLIVLSGCGDVARSHTKTADEELEEKTSLRVGIVTIAVGAFIALVPSAAVHILPFVCGVALVVDGLSELYLALTMEPEE